MDEKERQAVQNVKEEQIITKQELKECREDLAEEKHALSHVFWMIGFIAIIFGVTFWLAPNVFERDPESLLRYALLTIPMVLFNVCILLLSLVLLDFIVPGQILRKIGEDSLSSAILFAAMLIAIGIAMIAGGS
jgi:hypothetical protein